jgi:NAD(P)H-nitrite reductase large subunit
LVITQGQVRTKVGVKENSDDAMLCYCFGVTKGDAASDQSIRAYIIRQTKLGICACDARNPAGVCCLKTFPRTTE